MEIDRSSNRLSYALVIAALIVGGAWTMQTGAPEYRGYPVLSLVFFIVAFILGLVLMVSIYKEGKTRY
jgi:ubiquinone biosynthesis protein